MAYARKVDRNHGDVKAFFEAHGCVVYSTAGLSKFVDLVVGYVPTLRVVLVEVKHGKGKLRTSQEQFKARFPMVHVVRDDASALEVVQWLKAS